MPSLKNQCSTTHLCALWILLLFPFAACNAQSHQSFTETILLENDQLKITQIAPNAWVHTSYLQTNDFGYVPCNGLLVRDNNELIVFDTPTNNQASELLIQWITDSLRGTIQAVIPTHFHEDCLGGLEAFHQHHIPSYAFIKTIALAKDRHYTAPQHEFSDSLNLPLGHTSVTVRYFGEGHTRDNVVGYFPAENILFGGCLIKEINAGKGYLGDANVKAWSKTVENLRHTYPKIQCVVPGHGLWGGTQLLDYTIQLFQNP